MDIPWVHLVWNNYYANGQLPGQQEKGSFWWKDIVKLLDHFKGLDAVSINSWDTVLFWQQGRSHH
jgi:hypothetical protein